MQIYTLQIGVLCSTTGGQIFHYPSFNSRKDGDALSDDIRHNVTRLTGYDGIMLVRCSAGLKVSEQYGNYFRRSAQEMDLPTIDCDKAFGVVRFAAYPYSE
jgi:protein transport protein SEC24